MNLEENLQKAIERLKLDLDYYNFEIYPFTTENISGYINEFDLKDKSLLTVGSSLDQVLNAAFYGCTDITLLDKNSFSKYYYYLKITCILCLNINEFLLFLRLRDYNGFKDNENAFKKEIYIKIKSTLRILDYESYLFWDELFTCFEPIFVRKKLFSNDEYRNRIVKSCNPYLKDNESYNTLKRSLSKIDFKFIDGDLFNVHINNTYDNIWLSNIGTWLDKKKDIKKMVNIMDNVLNENGKMLISYLYRTTIDTKYEIDWVPIYDLKNIFKLLDKYNPELISFQGIKGIVHNNENFKDSILVYKKKD